MYWKLLIRRKVIGMLSYDLLLHDIQNPSNAFKTLSEGQKEVPGPYLDVNLGKAPDDPGRKDRFICVAQHLQSRG